MGRPAKLSAGVIAIAAYLFVSCFSAFAQSVEEKNFLSMYFTEEELTVQSATRSPKPVSQTAENTAVVTAADIELMNAHTLADVLNTVTGVQIFFTPAGPGQIAQAFIQGSERRHVTVIIDGVVLNNLGNNTVDLGAMPVQNVEKIEIIKGPASSAWGSALGGVVNIITKSGNAVAQGGMLSGSYGTKNTGDFRAEARGKQNRFGYYLYAGRLQSDGLTPHFDVSENNGYAKLTYDLTDSTNVLFAIGYAKTSRGAGLDELYDTSYENVFKLIHSTLAVNSVINKDVELNVSFRTLRQEFIDSYYTLSSGAFLGEAKNEDNGYGSSAKLTWKMPTQTIVLGADYDDKKLESNVIAGGEQGITKLAFYANDTLVFNNFSVTPGIRHDHISTSGDITSPSLGVTYSVANSTIVRASAAKGFSIPTLGETFGDSVYYTANPNLKAETVWSYQIGAETAAVKYVWMKLSAFRNDIRDGIISAPSSTTTFTRVNGGRQRRQGVEIALRTAPVYNTSISAGSEFIDAEDLDTGAKIQGVPAQVYDIGIRYDDERSFEALLQGRYVNWNAEPMDNGKYGSFIFDFSSAKKIYSHKDSSLEAIVAVHNIFDGSQYSIDIFKNPGRWYEGGIRYKF